MAETKRELQVGETYLFKLKSGEILRAEYRGPYKALGADGVVIRDERGEVALEWSMVDHVCGVASAGKDKPLDAVHVTFSCGHEGGVWPEDALPGTPKFCLECRDVVQVEATEGTVIEFPRKRQ